MFKPLPTLLKPLTIYRSLRRAGLLPLFACLFTILNPQKINAQSARALAYDYLQQNHIEEAKLAFLKAIKTDPKEVLNYRDLALLYLSDRDYPKAEAQVNAGLRLNINDVNLRSVLAEIYLQKGDRQSAVRELNNIVRISPKNIYAYYKLALTNAGNPNAQKTWLLKAIAAVPANIVPRFELCEILAAQGKSDSALYYLQSVKKIAPDLSAVTASSYNKAARALQGNHAAEALNYIREFHNRMKATAAYAHDLQDVEGPILPVGRVEFTTSQVVNKYANTRKVTLQNMKFTDATKSVGLEVDYTTGNTPAVMAVTDYSEAGEMYLFTGGATKSYLFTGVAGNFQPTRVVGGVEQGKNLDAAFADYDNDGFPDLFVATTGGILVYKNQGDGTFSRVRNNIGLAGSANANKMLFADLDQDGDLDLYLAQTGANKFYRNNGNGTFTEQAAVVGITAAPPGSDGVDFADFDADGDLDIIATSKTGLKLFTNDRRSKFRDIAGAAQIASPNYAGTVIACGDYNNDGLPDIFAAGRANATYSLFKNLDGKRFTAEGTSKAISAALADVKVQDALFFDFDNDGHLDLLVTGKANKNATQAVLLFHNDTTQGFSNVTNLLAPSIREAYAVRVADFNGDGDDDIFLATPTGPKIVRNDGGNLNHYLQIQLTGFSYGNGKNNRMGIGAQVELKAGDLYQLKTVKSPLVTFGVGMRNTLDAVRITWPNGVSQIIADPSRNERIVEKELLKGSCPFLFTWNGEKYEFIKDMMWRSALGMPVAIHNTDTTYAYSEPSKEYLLIPGEKLQEKDGRYNIKVTEELWEAVYFDKIGLVAVDHPDSTGVYVDERFVAPPYPGKTVYSATHRSLPVSAKDGDGNDLSNKISNYDFQYAASFSPGKYQGIAESHDIILDLGDKAMDDNVQLFLRGWIFPADASINTAVTQSDEVAQRPPYLQVINAKGEWETVIDNIGFPMGRDKMVIANLAGKFLTPNDRRVRICTNMQIYWDNIFFTAGNNKAPVQLNDMVIKHAMLGYHGYSATSRKGGPFGPEWLDYYSVTKGQKWRDLTGSYTRYGDVTPLLQQGDDKYIIASSGDEITIGFDAAKLPPLRKGWKRDFLIYSEGWVKDGDLNTANGQTVEPLPFHAMPAYPYSAGVVYPTDKEHDDYQRTYNTRKINGNEFRDALKVKRK